MPENTDPNVFEIVLHGTAFGQETINVFHYSAATVADLIHELIDKFDTQVVDYLTSFMNAQAGFTLITAQAVKGVATFGSKAISKNGVGGGEMLPPWVSWDFTYVRGAALERNGYKRFSGIGESSQANGVPTTAVIAVINSGISALSSSLLTTTDEYVPVIKRTRVNRIPQHPPKYYSISTVQFSKLGSQNSRKPGHGR